MKTYILMGVLCAIAAAIASARLNGATLDVGQSYELYVIAAAVVGGTSFAGGIGTIPGAVLGAFVMQSLAYGLGFIGVNSPGQNIVAGIVLVVAVGFDTYNRRRGGGAVRSSMTVAERVPLVEMRNINVAFGGVHAVRDVTVDLYAGEVIGLVGGNGAGKSTLMRVLSGAHAADSGEILIDGEPVTIGNPRDAKAYNIETIYQTLALADNVDAPANLFLGREMTTRLGTLDDAGDGVRDAQGHGPPEPELHALQRAGQVAVRRPAPGRRDRPGRLLQRPDPDHGRADRRARPGRDRPGPQPHPPAQERGHRHLPDQPRHPRRLRPVRPDQRHVPRPHRGHRQQGRGRRRTRCWA